MTAAPPPPERRDAAAPTHAAPAWLALPAWARGALQVVGWLAVAAVALPVATLVFGATLAAPRYVTGLPLSACAALVLGACAAAGAAAWRFREVWGPLRPPRLLPWLLWATCAALMADWLFHLLWVPETHGLVTVGGGDAGHHMGIAHQVATLNPKVYVGQTGAHTTAWLLGQLAGLGIADALAWGWIGGGMAFYALVLAAVTATVRDLRPAAQWVAIPLAAGLMVSGSADYVPMWLHYYQAEGFFGHLYCLVPLALLLLASASADRWWLRVLAATCAVGVLRFTYALNAGEALVALALLAWGAALARGPRWWQRAALGLAGVGACGAAWFAWTKLWALQKMTGGIMPHDLTTETVVLGTLTLVSAGVALCTWVAGRALALPSLARVSRAALVLAVLALCPWLVHRHWDLHWDLPREYYYRKHATLALLTLSVALPALAATLYAHAVERRQALALAVLAVATLHFTDAVVAKQALAGKRIAWSYRERVDPKVRWRINTPLWEPRTQARMQAVLRERGKRFGGYQHPSWPVHSAMNSAFPGWRPTVKQTVVDIKEARWKEWIQGLPARPGTCRFFTAARAELIGFARHDRRMKGKTFPLVRQLLARRDLRCERWQPPRKEQKPQRLCWVCD